MILINEVVNLRYAIPRGDRLVSKFKPKKSRFHLPIIDYYIDEGERYRQEGVNKYYHIFGIGERKRFFPVDKEEFEEGKSKSCLTAEIQPVGEFDYNGYPIYVDDVNGVYMISLRNVNPQSVRQMLEELEAVPVETMWDFLNSDLNQARYL